MKTLVNSLSFVIFTCLLLFSPALISGQLVEKRVNGSTYVFDYTQKKVYNRAAVETQEHSTTGFFIEPNTYVADTFRKVLGKGRIDELKQERVGIYFVCDNAGHVKTIRFLFLSKPFFTPEEISQLENALSDIVFPVVVESKETGDIGFAYPIWFRRL